MFELDGSAYRVKFYDHTLERIKRMKHIKRTDDTAKAMLGNHQGTVAIIYRRVYKSEENPKMDKWDVFAVGVSRVFTGNDTLPADQYRKKEGHARSVNKALISIGLERPQRIEFIKAWQGANK